MGAHINEHGEFQSDKYPTCPPGKVPLSVKDPTAQPFLWAYAEVRRAVDAEFTEDLHGALCAHGYEGGEAARCARWEALVVSAIGAAMMTSRMFYAEASAVVNTHVHALQVEAMRRHYQRGEDSASVDAWYESELRALKERPLPRERRWTCACGVSHTRGTVFGGEHRCFSCGYTGPGGTLADA